MNNNDSPRYPKRILLCAEAVTLAHVARPLAVAKVLAGLGRVITLACDRRYRRFLSGFSGEVEELPSIEPAAFLKSLRRGTPVYGSETIERYIGDDLRVIERSRPELIIGDFRLSLSISARLAGVPYVALANAYWSAAYRPPGWPVPELPITHALPIPLARVMFRAVRPAAFALHSRALNKVRRRHGLADLGPDLRRAYTDADRVAYADVPELFPMSAEPPSHRFIGPILWEPPVPPPAWWDEPSDGRPAIYVTIGSSGHAALLARTIQAVAALDANVMVATAGVAGLGPQAPNVRATDFLPGIEAAKRASLVVCNGGSLACYQALSAGVPVIGIASNLDQFLNMQAVERVGAGTTLRADRFRGSVLAATAKSILAEPGFARNAARVRAWCASRPLGVTVPALLAA